MVSAAISEIIHPGIHYTSSQVAEFRNNVNSGLYTLHLRIFLRR